MSRQGFRSLVIVVAICLAVLAIGWIWYYEAAQTSREEFSANQITPQQSSTAETNATSPSSTIPMEIGVVSSTKLSADGKDNIYSNTTYGVSFSYPVTENFATGVDTTSSDAILTGDLDGGDFIAPSGATMLSHIGIFPDLYPNSDFSGGLFALLVNATITDASSCDEFGSFADDVLSPSLSFPTIHGITYVEITDRQDSMTVSQRFYELHTFKNNVCYEADLEIDIPETILPREFSREISPSQTAQTLLSVFLSNIDFSQP
jgi:hypothetical protein